MGIDEAHLYVSQSQFHFAIRRLRDMFWKLIFPKYQPETHPAIYAMTATMTLEYVQELTKLTTIPLPLSSHLWSTWQEFKQLDICLEYKTASQSNYGTAGLDRVVKILTNGSTRDDRVVAFATVVSTSTKLREKLDKMLNEKRCTSDIVHVNGHQHKNIFYLDCMHINP